MSEEMTTTDEQELRARAVKRWKKQRDFRIHVLMYVVINLALVVIWAVTGAKFFWPVFVIVPWGIGVVGAAWDAFSRELPTETEIRRTMDQLRTRS